MLTHLRGISALRSRTSRWLVVMFAVDTFGTGLFIAGSTVFFTRFIGLTAGQVATGVSISALTGFLATVPTGVLGDRLGIRRVQSLLHMTRASGFVAYTFVGSFPAFVVVAALIGIGDRSSPALNQALVALAVRGSDERVRLMGVLRAVKNLFFTVGGLVAVALLGLGGQAAFLAIVWVNAASFVVVAIAVRKLPLTGEDRQTTVSGIRAPSLRDRRYTALAGLNGLLQLHNSVLVVGLPLFVLHRTEADDSIVPALFTINALVVMAGQIPISRAADTLRGSSRALLVGGLTLAAVCPLFASAAAAPATRTVWLLVIGVVVLSVGEMLQAAGGWGVSFALADEQRHGEYLSVFSLGGSLEAIVGPAAVTSLVMLGGLTGWGALALVFVAAGILSRVLASGAAGPAPGGAGSVEREVMRGEGDST